MIKNKVKKIVTGILLFGYTLTGFLDALLNGELTYSSVMGMDLNRLYFYTFFLLIIGCWLLYNKWFVGIGFLVLAAFGSYFTELIDIHNYLGSIAVYIGIIIDMIIRKKIKWLVPMVIIGIIQGIAFQTAWPGYYLVGGMEFTALCTGSVFIVREI